MLFVIYTGNPGDPTQQYMKLVRGSSYDDVKSKHPDHIAIGFFEKRKPVRQRSVDLKRLKRGMPVWSFGEES